MRKWRCLLKKVSKLQPAKIPSDGDRNDEVEDLKLEDLDADSVADLQDNFGANNDGVDDDVDNDSCDDDE